MFKIKLYLYSTILYLIQLFSSLLYELHLLPDIKFLPSGNIFIVNKQLFEHFPHVAVLTLYEKLLSFCKFNISDSYLAFFLAYSAHPKAPIKPAIEGLVTFMFSSFSKALKTPSFKNVPPCVTIFLPSSSMFRARITLYIAFLTIDIERPAEISSTEAPSFCACLTHEFINTVQREPKFTGDFENSPFLTNSSNLKPSAVAKVSKKEPQPEEHASFSVIESITLFFNLKHLMSCPPISITKSTLELKCCAAVRCAIVSTSPKSIENALRIRSSP